MNADLNETLYAVPPQAQSYADSVFELDTEDIPVERIPLIKEVMLTAVRNYDVIMAARVLTSWGIKDGFDFLEKFVCDQEPTAENLMPHRLRGYDDTCTQILNSMVDYWAGKADAGSEAIARTRLLRPMLRIIDLSSTMAFGIDGFFWLIDKKGYTEYIPALKKHLEAIIKDPKFHHWKVADCAHLLMKFEPDFVTRTLAAHGYTLANFPNK
jgi:hypothetical protein